MFNPADLVSVTSWTSQDLVSLPDSEDERHEYKSSQTSDKDLSAKISRAASAFWNSGGGLFVAGVNGVGEPDGGITTTVGRQSRRDWIDQAIARTVPSATYVVHAIESGDGGLNIQPERAVYVVAFAASEAGPHMASDHVYYIRGGAHTVPASHFVVEAIHARRGLTRPLLRWTLRHKPSNYSVIQLGIVALSSAPALDVQIQFDRLPRLFRRGSEDRFPLRIPVVNAENPFFFDFDAPTFGQDETDPLEMQLRYTDIAGHEYDFSASVDIERQIGPVLIGTTEGQKIERQLDKIEHTLRNIAGAIGKNESHLRDLVRKVR